MPRPQTKDQLLAETETEYAALEDFLAGLSPEEMLRPGALGDWPVKDVLAHLTEWQRMFFAWYEAGLRAEKAPMPAEGYKWSQLPALNQAIYLRDRDLPLAQVLDGFRTWHQKTQSLILALSSEELTQPGRYAWAGEHALIGFISSNCGNHYRWARTEMRKAFKRQARSARAGTKI
jgi:hypothetical protein